MVFAMNLVMTIGHTLRTNSPCTGYSVSSFFLLPTFTPTPILVRVYMHTHVCTPSLSFFMVLFFYVHANMYHITMSHSLGGLSTSHTTHAFACTHTPSLCIPLKLTFVYLHATCMCHVAIILPLLVVYPPLPENKKYLIAAIVVHFK